MAQLSLTSSNIGFATHEFFDSLPPGTKVSAQIAVTKILSIMGVNRRSKTGGRYGVAIMDFLMKNSTNKFHMHGVRMFHFSNGKIERI